MDEYKLTMPIRFLPDQSSLDDIKRTLDTLDSVKLLGDNTADVKSMLNAYTANTKTLDKLTSALEQYKAAANLGDNDDETSAGLKQMIKDVIGDNKSLQEKYGLDEEQQTLSKFFGQGGDVFAGIIKTKILGGLANLGTSFLSSLAGVFKKAWNELNDMLQSSLLTNSTTRENAFTYGFSAAESYGFEQAKSMLGISSEEDLWYMNDEQSQKFREIMTKYADKYNELADKGFFDKMLEFQIESQEFQLDMQMEVIEFFMDNKDTIVQFFDIAMWGMETIVDLLGGIVGLLSPDDSMSEDVKNANINSILKEYSNNSQTTFTQNNNTTFNGATDSQTKAYVDMLNASMVETKRALEG